MQIETIKEAELAFKQILEKSNKPYQAGVLLRLCMYSFNLGVKFQNRKLKLKDFDDK